jgi:DNA-binding transcriptional LysR family regulator
MDLSSKTPQFYYKNNRLQQIRGFCNTVMCGSMIKASEIMGLTQSTISLQIKTLERDLKKTLLQRSQKNSKRFSLTEDGKIFYEMALPIVNATDDLGEQFFLKSAKHHESILKIAGHHSVFSIIIPKALKQIKDLSPNIRLQLSYLERSEALKKLTHDEIDIAIYPVENIGLLPRNLIFKKISDYKPALIMPIAHPLASIDDKKITFKKIGQYNYIHTGSYAISDLMKYNIAAKVLKSDIELNNGSWDILKSLVAAGLGVTILHEDYCLSSKDIVIKKVGHLSPDIAYYAIFKEGSKPKKLALDLISLISSVNLHIAEL